MSEAEIYMVPPPAGKVHYQKDRWTPRLVTRNTGRVFNLSEEDFERAKEVQWFEINGEVVTRNGVSLKDYLANG